MPLEAEAMKYGDKFGVGQEYAFVRCTLETRAFFVINMRFGINPNQAMASARRGRFRRCLSARAFRWGCSNGSRTGCRRRILRFEHIAQAEFW